MTDTTNTTTDAPDPLSTIEEWKGHARKWEDRAKEANARLADLQNNSTSHDDGSTSSRITDLEAQLAHAQHQLLVQRIQHAHGLSDEDAQVLLTGTDEATLTAQATRLAGVTINGNVATREGDARTTGKPKDSDVREFAASLFTDTL
ncbi:hypothetical protein [Microbacterium sp. ZW T5_56]|uniref:hypothetical protein n=1 Tax=Microbacterium sp. ZW T5_56 TaxID=3378081 RepID=UPI00385499AB